MSDEYDAENSPNEDPVTHQEESSGESPKELHEHHIARERIDEAVKSYAEMTADEREKRIAETIGKSKSILESFDPTPWAEIEKNRIRKKFGDSVRPLFPTLRVLDTPSFLRPIAPSLKSLGVEMPQFSSLMASGSADSEAVSSQAGQPEGDSPETKDVRYWTADESPDHEYEEQMVELAGAAAYSSEVLREILESTRGTRVAAEQQLTEFMQLIEHGQEQLQGIRDLGLEMQKQTQAVQNQTLKQAKSSLLQNLVSFAALTIATITLISTCGGPTSEPDDEAHPLESPTVDTSRQQ